MALAVCHRNNPTVLLKAAFGLSVRRETGADTMASLQGKTEAEMQSRFNNGHRAYVGMRNGSVAAFGWVATRIATIGALNSVFAIPARERYLWNFVTLPAFRGQGIYPHMLLATVNAESHDADRFWIAYAPENHASAAGIRRAGFAEVAELSFDSAGAAVWHGRTNGNGAMASRMLGLPNVERALTPCWRCVRAGRGAMACKAGECRCDYQHREKSCAA